MNWRDRQGLKCVSNYFKCFVWSDLLYICFRCISGIHLHFVFNMENLHRDIILTLMTRVWTGSLKVHFVEFHQLNASLLPLLFQTCVPRISSFHSHSLAFFTLNNKYDPPLFKVWVLKLVKQHQQKLIPLLSFLLVFLFSVLLMLSSRFTL